MISEAIEAIRTAFRRLGQAREARANEKREAALTRERDARNSVYRRPVWAFITLAMLCGCDGNVREFAVAVGVAAIVARATMLLPWRALGFVPLALALTACGPSRATRTAQDEVRVMDAQCSAELDALHFDPGPNPDGEARVQAVLAGCQERAHAFCAAHHFTHADTEICP